MSPSIFDFWNAMSPADRISSSLGALGLAGGVVGFVRSTVADRRSQRANIVATAAKRKARKALKRSADALEEANRLTRDRIPDRIDVAYENLMAALSPLVSIGLITDLAPYMSALRLALVTLSDRTGQPELARYLEANRLWILHRASESSAATFDIYEAAGGEPRITDVLAAAAPFHSHVAIFSSAIRYWYSHRDIGDELTQQSELLERMVSEAGFPPSQP